MRTTLRGIARKSLSVETRRALVRRFSWPPVGLVKLLSVNRLNPVSTEWGLDRGRPVDRYFIEKFLHEHSDDIRGRVLEIGSDRYTREFGGSAVTSFDVLHVEEERPPITIIGDLTDGLGLESAAYDCVILTQTLNAIYDLEAAIRTTHRILKPGGTVLATVPGISKVSRYDMDRWGYYWSFTTASARRVFESAFPPSSVQVTSWGNVSLAVAFLHGLSWTELSRRTLGHRDPDYQLVITVRAKKLESA